MKLPTIIGCVFVANVQFVEADEYHYNNLLIGAEALGLGGAFVSVANDMSATHYNPAGLSYVKNNSSASINTFAWEQTEFSNIFSNGDDFTRDSFSVVPGFFGASTRLGKWTVGGSLAVTDFSNERTSLDSIHDAVPPDGADSQTANEYISIDLESSAYRLAFSGAYQISDGLSFGSSLQLEYRDLKTVQASGVLYETNIANNVFTSGFNATRRYTDTNIIMRPSFGVIWKKSAYSFGLRMGKDFGISRNYEGTSTAYIASNTALPSTINIASRFSEFTEKKQKYPFHIAMGNSYEFDSILVSLDLTYYSEADKAAEVLETTIQPVTRLLKQVVNFSFGMAYQVAENSYVKFGVFSDKSNGVIDTNIDYQRIEDIDLYGVSLAYETEIMTHPVSMGIYHKFGKGKIRTSDIRRAEDLVGLAIYPPSDNFDIRNGKKQTLVAYLSVGF